MSVSVSGNLPAGDGNGLAAIVSELIRNPKQMHVCIAIVDTRKVTTDADSGDVTPTVRIRRIEVIGDAEDMRVAERLMRRSLDQRTGREALPYDLEAEMAEVFEHFDPNDGANPDEDSSE
jgi:hypothetical protein